MVPPLPIWMLVVVSHASAREPVSPSPLVSALPMVTVRADLERRTTLTFDGLQTRAEAAVGGRVGITCTFAQRPSVEAADTSLVRYFREQMRTDAMTRGLGSALVRAVDAQADHHAQQGAPLLAQVLDALRVAELEAAMAALGSSKAPR